MGEPSGHKRLSIYMNDHLAGSTIGLEMVQRIAGSNRGTPLGNLLERLTLEIKEDRRTLERLMEVVGAGRDRVKVTGAWASEKVGRLKLNGQLRGYSPLSRLEELESLRLGITGKREMWKALSRTLGDLQGFDFDELAARADRQAREIEPYHLEAAKQAFSGATAKI
jgi:hypothetical protein